MLFLFGKEKDGIQIFQMYVVPTHYYGKANWFSQFFKIDDLYAE